MQLLKQSDLQRAAVAANDAPESAEQWQDGKPLKIGARQALFRIGESCQRVYRVKAGLVKSSRINADGVEQIAGFYVPGDVVGFDGYMSGVHSINAMTMEASVLEPIDKSSSTCTTQPHQLIEMMAREIHFAQEHLTLMNKTPAESRLAAFLISINSRLQAICDEINPWISISRMDMASFLGITNETVSRMLKRFEADQLVELKGRKLRVADCDALKTRGTI